MIKITLKKLLTGAGALSLLLSAGVGIAHAEGSANVTANPPHVEAGQTQTQQQHLANIKSRGDAEINRRLTTLNSLSGKISSDSRLSSTAKTTLTAQVTSEISNLTSLKAKLDAETTLDGASADAKSIISDYRVYALIVPKILLIRTADDQLVVESKLTALAGKLQSRISQAQSSGKDVSTLTSLLSDLNSKVSASQAISSSIEQKVINLQPSDYDSDHTVLSGDRAQLQTAHEDNAKALQDAKTIVAD